MTANRKVSLLFSATADCTKEGTLKFVAAMGVFDLRFQQDAALERKWCFLMRKDINDIEINDERSLIMLYTHSEAPYLPNWPCNRWSSDLRMKPMKASSMASVSQKFDE
jgi:hypothetical protein